MSEESADPEMIALLRSTEKPFATASDLADQLGVSRQYAHERLSDLHDAGEVCREKVGAKAVVWWVEDR